MPSQPTLAAELGGTLRAFRSRILHGNFDFFAPRIELLPPPASSISDNLGNPALAFRCILEIHTMVSLTLCKDASQDVGRQYLEGSSWPRGSGSEIFKTRRDYTRPMWTVHLSSAQKL